MQKVSGNQKALQLKWVYNYILRAYNIYIIQHVPNVFVSSFLDKYLSRMSMSYVYICPC